MQFLGGLLVDSVPGMVPSRPHVQVNGFLHLLAKQGSLEIAIENHLGRFYHTQRIVPLAECTKLVSVGILTNSSNQFPLVDNHLLGECTTTLGGRLVHRGIVILVKELPFTVIINESAGIAFAAITTIPFTTRHMLASDIEMVKFLEALTREAGCGAKQNRRISFGRHGPTDKVNP